MEQGKSSFFTKMLNLSDFISVDQFEDIKKRLFKHSTPEPNTGCHIWFGACYINGYGTIGVSKKVLSAHRVSYFVYKGDIPEDFVVDHLCNNKFCINPDHLEAKTQHKNILRSNAISVQNASKTHCNNGHEFTKDNTRINKQGSRDCITCLNERKKKYYQKHLSDILEKKAEYYKKNRAAIRKYQTDRNRVLRGGNDMVKLKEEDIAKIRKLITDGLSSRKIAKMFGVSKTPILSIRNNKAWSHIK